MSKSYLKYLLHYQTPCTLWTPHSPNMVSRWHQWRQRICEVGPLPSSTRLTSKNQQHLSDSWSQSSHVWLAIGKVHVRRTKVSHIWKSIQLCYVSQIWKSYLLLTLHILFFMLVLHLIHIHSFISTIQLLQS